MPYGKPVYDPNKDVFSCEFPIHEADGTYHICNKVCQDLVRHVTRHHGITIAEYKKMLGLNKSESLMSERTKNKLRKNKNAQIGWANLKPQEFAFKKGENEVQSYTRSPQNRRRLRRLHLYRKPKNVKLKNTP